jgi:hypothetical protein
MSTIGNILKLEIERYAAGRVRSSQLFRAAQGGWLTSEHIRKYVSGILFQIRGTMTVLGRAEDRARAAGDHDLAAYYQHKLIEERGHDRWAENDLESLHTSGPDGGYDSTSAIGRLVAYLRTIVDQDACLFLSYIFLAEYLTVLVGPDWLQALEAKCGIPSTKVSVLANHVELDREHVIEDVRIIDALVVSRRKEAPMLEVLRRSIGYYEEFWNEVMSATSKAA